MTDVQEKFLTQQVCQKCSTQLNNSYKFITQAREVYKQYLFAVSNLPIESFEDVPQLLQEVPLDVKTKQRPNNSVKTTNSESIISIEIKAEPIVLECTPDTDVLMNEDKLQVNEIKEETPDILEGNARANEKEKASKKMEQKGLHNGPTYEEEM